MPEDEKSFLACSENHPRNLVTLIGFDPHLMNIQITFGWRSGGFCRCEGGPLICAGEIRQVAFLRS
jgi:hypothetical protein